MLIGRIDEQFVGLYGHHFSSIPQAGIMYQFDEKEHKYRTFGKTY
jgi:hypothetical protein